MSNSKQNASRPWNATPRSSHELEPATLEDASWALSLNTPNVYRKDDEESKSLLRPLNESRGTLHDITLDHEELSLERHTSQKGFLRRYANYWNHFSKTKHGKLFLLIFKTLAIILYIALLMKETLNFFSPTPVSIKAPAAQEKVCTSKLWSNGHWQKRNITSMALQPPIRSMAEAMKVSNFPASYCASNRLPLTNTAIPRLENDTAEFWDWRYRVSSYDWRSGCEAAGLAPKPHPTPEQLIQYFLDEGGWLMIGDSLSAQWFMSLSCYLAPYVNAVPYFTETTPWNATQHLYLNNITSLDIKLPSGFNMDKTPLVTVLRSGLLLAKTQIKEIIEKNNLITDNKPLFGPEKVFDMHTTEYVSHFLNPELRYSKMIASAGAHYTAMLFQDRPFHKIGEIFHYNFEHWAKLMTEVLKDPRAKNKKILYRTATAGHDKCYLQRAGPWNEEKVLETPVWNWQTIPLFNKIADAVLTSLNVPRLELMSVDRPAMLRPDAHILIDCLHFTVGSGIPEGWTDFVYNYT